jgi:hypothetical protein
MEYVSVAVYFCECLSSPFCRLKACPKIQEVIIRKDEVIDRCAANAIRIYLKEALLHSLGKYGAFGLQHLYRQ